MVQWLDSLISQAGSTGLLVLMLAAAIEYVFPPFPGDTVTVFGGLYAVRGCLSVPLVFASIMVGSLLGSMVDYVFGRWVGRKIALAPGNAWYLRRLKRERILEWENRFKNHGAAWLLLNRFLPAVRGPIFFAAGVVRMSAARVLFWGGLSALVWNGLLFYAGFAVGGKAERLESLLHAYWRLVWAALIGLALLLVGRALYKRIRGGRVG